MSSETNTDLLHSFFELSSELMAVLSEDGCFEDANPAWQKNLGWNSRDLKGLPFFDLLHPEDLSKTQLEIQKLHQGIPKSDFASRCRAKNQEHRWIRWTCYFMKEEKQFYLTGQDITGLKDAEKALEENKAKFQRLSESSTEGIAIHENGVILEANHALARIFGFDRAEEMAGKNGLELTAPEYRQLISNNIQADYEEPYEVVGLRKDGSRFNCLVSGKPILYQGRKIRVSTFLDVTKMKKREQELFESQDLSRKLTEASRDGVAVSEKGVVLMANPALARMFKCEVSEMIGHNALEFTAPEFRETLLKKVMDEVETTYEVMGLRKDGTRFPVEISPRMTTYQGRRVRVAFFHDITQRKKIEEEVIRQKEFSQNLINSSIDGLMAFDRDCRYTLWNPAMERLTGHSREEVLGQCAFDVFPFLKQIGQDRHFYEALEGKTAVTRDRPFRTPAGRQGFFEAAYSPLKNVRGEIIGGLGIIHETTERKKMEEALEESETNLRAVFHNTFQNIILMDRECRIKAFNPNAAAFTLDDSGKKLEVGRDFAEYLHPENVEFFRKSVQQVLEGEAVQVEQSLPAEEGEVHWFEVNYHPVFGASGEIEGVCLTSLDIDERKRVQQALENSEADLRAVFNSSSRGFILVGRNGKIQDFNHLAVESVRRNRDQELEVGLPLADYVEPEHTKAFKERFKKVLQGETVHLERVVKSPSGLEEWFEFTYNPVCDPQGKVIGVCAAIGSIQARKDAEEAIRKSESNLRAIFNSSTQGITVVDRDGIIQYFNQAAAAFTMEFMGKALQIGKSLTDDLAPAARESFREKVGKTLQGEVVRGENQFRFRDGSLRWFEYTYHPVLDETGAVAGVCLTSLDIDGRKKAAEALQESEEKFRRIFEDASTAMAMVNDFKFIKVNRAFQELLGYAPGEIIGKSLFEITHPEDLAETEKVAHLVHQNEKDRFRVEKRYLKKNGESLWVQLSATVIRDGQGNKLYSLIMVENITERKLAQEALQKSEADLKAVFNSGSQVVVLIGPDGNIQNFNQTAEVMAQRVLGGPLQKGTPFIQTLPPGADPKVFEASFLAALQGREIQGERSVRSAEGRERWVEVKYQPVLNEQKAIQGVCFSLAFIDERKRAEEALRESQERLQRFTELTREGILIHEHGLVVDANPALAAMMGYAAEEMTGKNGLDFLAPESREEAHRRMVEGSVAPYEVLALRKDGSTFPVELQGRNFKEKGRDLRVLSVRDLTWQKATERILTESEERYRKLVELSPEALLVHAGGKVLYMNPSGLKMFGASTEQMEGSPVSDLLTPGSRSKALDRTQFIVETGQATEWAEMKLARRDGRVFEAETKGTPILYRGIPGVLTIVRDITERKEAEDTLRESEERYRKLVELSPEAVVVHAQGKILYVNSAGIRMFGATPDKVDGSSVADFLHPDHRGETLERVRRIVETGQSNEWTELKLLRLDGQVFEAETKGTPFLYNGIPGVLTIVRDITERKKVEMALRDSENDYRRLVAEIPLALVVMREGGVIVSANSESARLLGAGRSEDLIGKSALDFILPENKDIVLSRITRTLEEGLDAENRETELVTLTGQRIQVEVRGIPITFQGKRLALSILRDVTESKRINEMLLRYERLAAVGKVIAAIAHEVRNPLTVVSGMSQILKAKLENRSEFHQELETILAQASRLKYFMNDILDYSKNLEIRRAPVNPRTLLEESLILAQAQLGVAHAGSFVEWKMEASLPSFLADADRLQQVVVNLVMNAYQALEGAGTMTLSARVQDGWMILGVGDDGPGIPEADMAKLFEPFYTTKKGGSGLGLPISQKIAEAHGGRIGVKRLSPHGTLFTLQLPLEKAD